MLPMTGSDGGIPGGDTHVGHGRWRPSAASLLVLAWPQSVPADSVPAGSVPAGSVAARRVWYFRRKGERGG